MDYIRGYGKDITLSTSYLVVNVWSLGQISDLKRPNKGVHRDYSMENARVRFLFTSWVVSENERVSAANEW